MPANTENRVFYLVYGSNMSTEILTVTMVEGFIYSIEYGDLSIQN